MALAARKQTPPVTPLPAHDEDDMLSPAQQKALESLRDDVNRLQRAATQRFDEIADKLFVGLFGGQIAPALSPHRDATAGYRAMAEMCEDSLLMDRSQLSRCVRIGALNAHFGDGGWKGLPWSIRAELLPLLGQEADLKRLASGIKAALKPGATARTVRQWVEEHLPERSAAARGRPTELSVAATNKMLVIGKMLKLASTRRLVAQRLRRQGKTALTSAVADIESTIKSLTLLREELVEV